MYNVLVFPCGSEIGLEVHRSLKYDKHITLYGMSSVPCHGSVVYRNYYEGIPFITNDSFMEELNTFIDEHQIDVLIPAYDDVIMYLSERREQLHCKLVAADSFTCEICRSKKKTYEYFRSYVFVPVCYEKEPSDVSVYPLFAKPDIGQGSEGVMKIRNAEEFRECQEKEQDYVITEYLPGEEFTIDCFTGLDGTLMVTSMRKRERMRNGISVATSICPMNQEARKIAEIINKELRFQGVWFFQLKYDRDHKFKLLEAAPRVAGSMSLGRVRGFNFILNAVYQAMGVSVSAVPHLLEHVAESRALSNDFILELDYHFVYLDFDDTVTLRGEINTEMIAFLYQCQNKGIKRILLTRHDRDIYDSLCKYHIDQNLFDEIIQIDEKAKKSAYIKEKDAIFIDDSFRERKDVSEKTGIPVFDLDAISALMDHRF